MSDYESEVGVLELFKDDSGEHSLSNGMSFTIIQSECSSVWLTKNPNDPLRYHAKILDDGKVSFCINYYSFNGESYIGCEGFIEEHLIEFGILKRDLSARTGYDCEEAEGVIKGESVIHEAIKKIDDPDLRSEALISLMELSVSKLKTATKA